MNTYGDGTHMGMSSTEFQEFWREADWGREYSLLVTGYSMRPSLLHERSVVFISKMSQQDQLKNGDIILFQRNGKFVLHRIYKLNRDGSLLVNGDAQCWREIISRDQILARVKRICRTNRTFSADAFWYKFYVSIWRLLFPIRPLVLRIWVRLAEKSRIHEE